jgi:molecular chaperone Hsp33
MAPTAIAAVGRLVTGAALLGASLKGREKLTLQISSDGPLRGADRRRRAQHAGADRCAGLRARTRASTSRSTTAESSTSAAAVGKGYFQVTRSFEIGQPYVGIVELQSGEIGDDIASYLMVSEQIPSVVALGVLANPGGIKAAGGVIAQVLPGASDRTIEILEAARARDASSNLANRRRRGCARSRTGTRGDRSRCALRAATTSHLRARALETASNAPLRARRDELRKMAREQPQTEAVCEFCKTAYVLSSDEVLGLDRPPRSAQLEGYTPRRGFEFFLDQAVHVLIAPAALAPNRGATGRGIRVDAPAARARQGLRYRGVGARHRSGRPVGISASDDLLMRVVLRWLLGMRTGGCGRSGGFRPRGRRGTPKRLHGSARIRDGSVELYAISRDEPLGLALARREAARRRGRRRYGARPGRLRSPAFRRNFATLNRRLEALARARASSAP